MIYIYGDSHAHFSFGCLKLDYHDFASYGVTMFRIGRDNIIINLNKDILYTKDDTIILSYGEIDCRCHIQRQINLGINEDDVINELVYNYFKTIKNNTINMECKIIIVGVIPPTKQYDYEILHGPVINAHPFVGRDEDRVRYTNKVNKLLEEMSDKNNYIYFNPYSYYTRPDGTLKHELSDRTVHLGKNDFFLEILYKTSSPTF